MQHCFFVNELNCGKVYLCHTSCNLSLFISVCFKYFWLNTTTKQAAVRTNQYFFITLELPDVFWTKRISPPSTQEISLIFKQ